MGNFARLNNPFRKSGSDSSHRKDPFPPVPYPTPPNSPTTPEPESPLRALLRRHAIASQLAERVGISLTEQDSPVTDVTVDEHRTWRDRRPRIPLRRRGSTAQVQPAPVSVPEPEPEPEPACVPHRLCGRCSRRLSGIGGARCCGVRPVQWPRRADSATGHRAHRSRSRPS